MRKHKWTIVAGAAVAAVVLLVGMAVGVGATFAQGPNTTPGAGLNQVGVCPYGYEGGMGQAARYGGQAWAGRTVDIVAQTLGISVDDLIAELQGGKSVAQVAQEHGVALDTVVNAIVAERETALDQAVADGRLTQEQVDQMLTNMRTNLTEQLQQPHVPGQGPSGAGLGSGMRIGRGSGAGLGNGTGLGSGTGRGAGMGRNLAPAGSGGNN